MLRDMIKVYGSSKNLLHHRFLVICLLGFSGFLRISELLDIQVKNIKVDKKFIEITIPKSKTDQFREGHKVVISDSDFGISPRKVTEAYLKKTNLIDQPESFLICRLAKTRKGHRAIGKSAISYNAVRETFMRFIRPICKDKDEWKKFCTHSMRSGGATTASNNGISEREIDLHGRWKSSGSRNRYIKDSISKRLKITESLGL